MTKPAGAMERPHSIYTQWHLDNWTDDDFAKHTAATRKTLQWLLDLEASLTRAPLPVGETLGIYETCARIEREDRLRDSNYAAGLQEGFRCGVAGDHEGYNAALKSREPAGLSPPAIREWVREIDANDIWERYLAETKGRSLSPQGALAFAVEAVLALTQQERS